MFNGHKNKQRKKDKEVLLKHIIYSVRHVPYNDGNVDKKSLAIIAAE